MSPARGCGRCRNGLVRVLDFDGEDTSIDVCPCQYLPQSSGTAPARRNRDELWHDRAECSPDGIYDPDLWWPDKNSGPDVDYALAICGVCAVKADCLAYALERHEVQGIWGGLMPEQRKKLTEGVTRNARIDAY